MPSNCVRWMASAIAGLTMSATPALAIGPEDAPATGAETESPQVPLWAYASADWPAHNGEPRSSNDYQGKPTPVSLGHETWITDEVDLEGKVVVVDFWATWCGPCHRAAPMLEKVQKDMGDDVVVLAMSGQRESEEKAREFIEVRGKDYSYAHDAGQSIIRAFEPQGIPFVVVLSSDGVVRWQGNPHLPSQQAFYDTVKQVAQADPAAVLRRTGEMPERPDDWEDLEHEAKFNLWPTRNPKENLRGSADRDLQGRTIRGALNGLEWLDGEAPDADGKVVVLDFWATWCGPCIAFSPRLEAATAKHEGRVLTVAVSGQGESKDTVEKYLRGKDIDYRHAHDPKQRVYKRAGINAIPHVMILDSEGVVRWQGFPGNVNFEAILDQVVRADEVNSTQG